MMAGCGQELDRAAAFSLRNLREELGQSDHDGHSRRVVDRALEVSVVMREDHDVLVARAVPWQRSPDVGVPEPGSGLTLKERFHFDWTGFHHRAERVRISGAD